MNSRNSLLSFLDDALNRSDECAYVQRRGLRKERWTYAQLAATAYQFARELEARGIGKGDRVLLWGANGGAWVAAWFGCLARGAVAVPLDETSTPDFIERIQQQVNAKLIVTDHQIDLPALPLSELRNAVSRHSSERYVDETIQPDELAQIIFTSGTTAEPKGVCLTHRNLLANLAPLEKGIDEYRRWERPFHPLRFLCLLPLSHVFGQFMGIFVPQLLGGEVHFSDSLNPADIIATTKRERISVIAAVPRQLETLRDKLERNYVAAGKLEQFRQRFAAAEGKHPLVRMWRFRDVHKRFGWKCWAFVAGGATLPVETEQFWMRLGFAVVQGYGMTETASLVSVNHPFKLSRGSIGKTLPGQELKLDADGTILVRGANVASGYWQAGKAHSLTSDGWLRTGDVGVLDAEGNLFFKGRAKDVIVTAAGLNIFPADLEAALNQQAALKESCVVGIETANGPEAIAVLIARDATPLAEAVQRANAALNEAQQLRRWLRWPDADFPRTATQKVRKPLVKQWAEQRLNGQTTEAVT
ncbi:MAG: AMP-binding protein, partial [Acidobacteria bacterium]|nr:AMP-binding protein [Acidobacteriota bacterium]